MSESPIQADRMISATIASILGKSAAYQCNVLGGNLDDGFVSLIASHRQSAEESERRKIISYIKRAEQEADLKLMDAKTANSKRNWASLAVGIGCILKALESGEHLK